MSVPASALVAISCVPELQVAGLPLYQVVRPQLERRRHPGRCGLQLEVDMMLTRDQTGKAAYK